MAVVTSVRLGRDADVSHARRTARTAVEALGLDLHDQTRFATAVSEIARNALQYARDGRVEFSVERVDGKVRLLAIVSDAGPGIEDIDGVLGGTYQSDRGLGLGIRGARRIADVFDLKTGKGGTVVTLGLVVDSAEETSALARKIAEAIGEASRRHPIDELTEQNRALRDAYSRQAFLQRELHHRTKNNLAIIHSYASMQARQVESEEARSALIALAGRVHALGLVHSFLHHADGVGHVTLPEYLGELTASLASAFGQNRAEVVCEVGDVSLDADRAVEIGIIVNELVTNAMKHATPTGPGALVVRVEGGREGDQLWIRVSDNGHGLKNAEEIMRNSSSLGWRVIQASVQKIGAVIETDGDKGLSVTVTCPL